MKKIKGTVQFQSLGTGFWSIIGTDGGKWRPVKMPKALQKEGLSGEFELQAVQEDMSIFMWGEAVKVVKYQLDH